MRVDLRQLHFELAQRDARDQAPTTTRAEVARAKAVALNEAVHALALDSCSARRERDVALALFEESCELDAFELHVRAVALEQRACHGDLAGHARS